MRQYIEKQIAEILSQFNRWVTGQKVGHDPTRNELSTNYVETGGAKRFAEENEIDPEAPLAK
jgi:hypothetical protein